MTWKKECYIIPAYNLLVNNKKPYIVFFHMNDCYWCEQMDPVVHNVAIDPDFTSIQFYSLNTQPELTQLNVNSTKHF